MIIYAICDNIAICHDRCSSSSLSTLFKQLCLSSLSILQDLHLIWAALMSSQRAKQLLSGDWSYITLLKCLSTLLIENSSHKWYATPTALEYWVNSLSTVVLQDLHLSCVAEPSTSEAAAIYIFLSLPLSLHYIYIYIYIYIHIYKFLINKLIKAEPESILESFFLIVLYICIYKYMYIYIYIYIYILQYDLIAMLWLLNVINLSRYWL